MLWGCLHWGQLRSALKSTSRRFRPEPSLPWALPLCLLRTPLLRTFLRRRLQYDLSSLRRGLFERILDGFNLRLDEFADVALAWLVLSLLLLLRHSPIALNESHLLRSESLSCSFTASWSSSISFYPKRESVSMGRTIRATYSERSP